jgi:indoleamine 2,3-dioxygenase
MQEYMPLSHRQFIHKIEQNGSIRDFIKLNCHPYPLLKDEYNDCITLLSRFRQTHLRYAAHYIQKQHQTSKTNPTAVGTGGTPFMNYLRKHKDETMKFLIN